MLVWALQPSFVYEYESSQMPSGKTPCRSCSLQPRIGRGQRWEWL